MNRGPKRIFYFLVVDENFFLTTGRQLTVEENGYALVFFPCYGFRSRDLLPAAL
jgi:hypothetical protein